MELNDFLEITGLVLTPEQEQLYDIVEARAVRRLNQALGWKLRSPDNYEEIGQFLNPTWIIDQPKMWQMFEDQTLEEYLTPPDEVTNSWRLFPYYDLNTNFRIDPCSAVYKMKLVYPMIGEEERFITICNFAKYTPLVGKSVDRVNYITYVTKLADFAGDCSCKRSNVSSPMLAVDAEWIFKAYPSDLEEVLADLIIYEYQNRPSLSADAGRPLKSRSESVDGHSISKTYADAESIVSNDPLQNDRHLEIIKSYMGPWSPYYKERRIY